jgi:hypothetical protein
MNRDRLWTPTLFTDEVQVEYYLPAETDQSAEAAQVQITSVLYQYVPAFASPAEREVACHLDVNCFADWQFEALGVAAVGSIEEPPDRPLSFRCSGAALGRVPGDSAPLFMTATHCDVTAANADTAEVVWFWQTDACNGSPPNPNTLPASHVAAVVVRDMTTDWTLLGLRAGLPAGVVLEGWNAGYLSNDSPTVHIHHPDRAWKRITFGVKQGDNGTRPRTDGSDLCESGNAYRTIVDPADGDGNLEGGSSGSPLFDSSGGVRGVLSCGEPPFCDINDLHHDYGRLDQAYPLLAPVLDPADPVYANAAFAGTERGTLSEPFRTLYKAVTAVITSSDLHIQAGSYPESLILDRAVVLHARNGTVTIGN